MPEFDPLFVCLSPAERAALGEQIDLCDEDDDGDSDWWRDA